jgi:hypothetical protein
MVTQTPSTPLSPSASTLAVLPKISDLLVRECQQLSEPKWLGNCASAAFPAKALELIGMEIRLWIRDTLLQDDINELLWLLSYLDPAGLRVLPEEPQPSDVKHLLELLTLR